MYLKNTPQVDSVIICHVFHKARRILLPHAANCTATADNSISGGAIKGYGGDGAELSARRNRFIEDSFFI